MICVVLLTSIYLFRVSCQPEEEILNIKQKTVRLFFDSYFNSHFFVVMESDYDGVNGVLRRKSGNSSRIPPNGKHTRSEARRKQPKIRVRMRLGHSSKFEGITDAFPPIEPFILCILFPCFSIKFTVIAHSQSSPSCLPSNLRCRLLRKPIQNVRDFLPPYRGRE